MNNTLDLVAYGPVIPVIVINRLEDAVPMAQALVDGGVRVLEVTLRTAIALKCMEAIARAVPDAVLGAGTVRSIADAQAAKDAGCTFAVSPGYTSQIGKLESEGVSVPLEDQSVNLFQTINSQAVQSGVILPVNTPQPERTNQFFLERAQSLTFQSSEAQLVDFLYKLGDGNSLIRVRALSLRPADPSRQTLGGNITLIASYQKKSSTRPASAAAPAPASVPAGTVKTNKPPALVVPAASKPATPTKK